MRVLLQRKDQGLYFQAPDDWIADCHEARDVGNSTAAIDDCLHQRLSGVQIVLKFDDEKYDIIFPLLPLSPDPSLGISPRLL